MLWVIVPACHEESSIGATLDALAGQTDRDFTLVHWDRRHRPVLDAGAHVRTIPGGLS
jgi:hypothetical protein